MTTEAKADSTQEIDKSKIDKDKKDKEFKEKEAKKLRRDSYIKTLEDLGVETKGLSDEDLLFKVVSELNKTNSKLASAQAEKEIKGISRYTVGITHKLKNEEFIARLFNLNVPNFYLHLFDDEEKDISDADVWKKIKESKINPFKSIKEIIESRNRYSY